MSVFDLYGMISAIHTDNESVWAEECTNFTEIIEAEGGLDMIYSDPGEHARENSRAEGANKIIHECEAMQGCPPGISGGFRSPLGTSYSQRLSHIGNALNGHQCYQILRHLRPGPVASANVHSMCFEKMTSAQVEHQFSQMTSAQLVDCFRKRAFGRGDGWKPAPPSHSPP